MSPQAKPIPEGFSTITPYLIVRNADAAIDFYKKAFGAKEISRQPGPDGKTILHATIKIGDSVLMLNDELPDWGCRGPESLGGTPVSIHLYVTDVDASFQRAIDAGAEATMPVNDTFWGDRFGKLKDPFGHEWSIATHTEDLTPQQISERAEKFFATCGAPSG